MKPPRWLPSLRLERLRPELEVNYSAAADFREGAELMNSLLLAVESIGTRIAIRQKAYRD